MRARRAQRGLQVVGGRGSGAVMVLVGPPGVGKTSLGESVARALGRKFVRVALGGVRDEAEIRGHRRTYVGALPGRIVRAISEAGSMNPVVLLDEIDKVGSDYRGDPSAALLEVLDPAQNHTFRDHYLDLDLDLSDVVFLATANVIENIPSALLDRMELVTIDGYTEDDKVAIARDFLLPRQLERAALTADEVHGHRRRAAQDRGRLHPRAGRAAARAAAGQGAAQGDHEAGRQTRRRSPSTSPICVEYLGRPRFTPESAERTAVPGVATGLAVTGLGGDVLYIEASADRRASRGLQLTGQLGDVMKESAQIALSYVRSHAEQLGVDPAALDRQIHVHVPAGAVPKDGPSAGVTMVTALVSMATGRQVRSDVGMTGEVTLNGRVLPIGGVKQKLLAAQRAGLSTVFIPQRNEPDLDDVPGRGARGAGRPADDRRRRDRGRRRWSRSSRWRPAAAVVHQVGSRSVYGRRMAYDEDLADRIRELVAAENGVDEKRMFGGLAFLINGNMSVAASGRGGLMVRVPPDETDKLLTREHVEPMVMAGRETRGWLRVSVDGVKTKRQLQSWVSRGVDYAKTLPPK